MLCSLIKERHELLEEIAELEGEETYQEGQGHDFQVVPPPAHPDTPPSHPAGPHGSLPEHSADCSNHRAALVRFETTTESVMLSMSATAKMARLVLSAHLLAVHATTRCCVNWQSCLHVHICGH